MTADSRHGPGGCQQQGLTPCPLLTAISYAVEAYLIPKGFTLRPHELRVDTLDAAFRANLQAPPSDGAHVFRHCCGMPAVCH
jgi:hypothetical protein